ncbi:MAG: hypothetical protein K2N95_06350 [Lachnospiraceae bacterium]|nr:hypothetical protein [Lachnospiraceae bacterium]
MKFKYMIRGMGLGVLITAAVMGAYSRHAVADARVAVLREYGLGEEARLVSETEEDSGEETSEEAPETEVTEPMGVRNEEIESEINSVLDAAKESEQGETQEQSVAAPADEETSDASDDTSSVIVVVPSDERAADDIVEIVIVSGDDSGTVARKLYNAGVIENASEYDAFLIQHGYDKRINTGTKTISLSDSWQEIAEKISSK